MKIGLCAFKAGDIIEIKINGKAKILAVDGNRNIVTPRKGFVMVEFIK